MWTTALASALSSVSVSVCIPISPNLTASVSTSAMHPQWPTCPQVSQTLHMLAVQPASTSVLASTSASVLPSVWSFTSARHYVVQRFCHHLCKCVTKCLDVFSCFSASHCVVTLHEPPPLKFCRIHQPASLPKLKLVCYQVPRTCFLLACRPVRPPALLLSTSANVWQGY